MALIELKDITKKYPDGTHALRGVSLEIKKGEFVAIMGPSGSGKSTLLHILGYLDRQTDGTYILDGKAFEEQSQEDVAHIRNKKMGFIFQMFNLLPKTTVLENVKLPFLYSKVKESLWNEYAQQVIEGVGLSHRINHETSQLSGGEKQRVAIARALVNNPQIIFADEPTGNLDSKSGKMIMETIERLNEEGGRTVILVTHETYTAEHAGRIIRLLDGEIKSDTQVTHRRHARDAFVK